MRRLIVVGGLLCWAVLCQDNRNRAADPQFLPDALKYLASDKSTDRAFALATMGLMGKDAMPACKLIVKSFYDSSADVRQAADLCLKNVNPPLYQPVVNLVQTKDYDARVQAIAALDKLGKDAAPAVPALLEFFKDGAKEGDRATLVKTLGTVGATDKDLTPVLAQMALKDPDPAVRQAALKALPNLPDAAGQVSVIIGAITNDKNANNRLEAITALSAVGQGNKDALKALQGLLSDPSPQVREAAKKALVKVQPK